MSPNIAGIANEKVWRRWRGLLQRSARVAFGGESGVEDARWFRGRDHPYGAPPLVAKRLAQSTLPTIGPTERDENIYTTT